MPKPTRELESFSSEVLAEFIRGNVPMLSAARTSKVFAELVYIEARQRLDSIHKEVDRLIAKGTSLQGIEHIKKYLAVQDQITKLWEEAEGVRKVAFPWSSSNE